jgi:iron complex transport system ATP-binding protein
MVPMTANPEPRLPNPASAGPEPRAPSPVPANHEPQTPNPKPGLTVDAVAFHYPNFELAPATFAAKPGEVVAIIGPNGSGKSTLLAVVSGRLKPLSGKVCLDGADIHRLSLGERARQVGLARQEAPLLFSFDVREFVLQGRHPHLGGRLFESPEDERWVEWSIERTDLVSLVHRRVTEISGGEFQRAILARTLAQRPRLLLLDEPTAHLDIGYQIEMLRLLRELASSEQFTSVIVTHELNLAAEFANSLLLLEGGHCLASGSPEQVLQADLLSRVFRTPVLVDRHPSSGRPRVTWAAERKSET